MNDKGRVQSVKEKNVVVKITRLHLYRTVGRSVNPEEGVAKSNTRSFKREELTSIPAIVEIWWAGEDSTLCPPPLQAHGSDGPDLD